MAVFDRKKPNILLITTDQQRADHLGVEGLEAICTPHLDRLATEGAHFNRAYCPSPICTPSRVSLLTGTWPSQHGAYSIGVTADPFPGTTVPQLLQDSGYATVLIGKAHFVSRKDEMKHFTGHEEPSDEFFREFHGPYLGFETVYTCIGHTTNSKPDMHYRVYLEEEAGESYRQWFPQLSGDKDFTKPGVWGIPEEHQNTAWAAATAMEWIRGRPSDRPWFCWLSFEDPHPPYVCPEPWFSSVDTELMHLFEGRREDEFIDKPAVYEHIYKNDTQAYSDSFKLPCAYGRRYEGEEERLAMQATLGMIANIDAKIGKILNTLEETGQLENTLIIYTSDHGEMHGHHGFWGKGLVAYEDNQRVPLLIWGPAMFEKRGTTSALANLVDVSSTILSFAGIRPPQGIQGTDLSPVLRKETESVQDSTIIECRATAKIYQQTLVTDRYKLVLYQNSGDGELYDLQQDPDQYENLWNKPQYGDLLRELLHKFVQKQMQREGVGHPRKAFA